MASKRKQLAIHDELCRTFLILPKELLIIIAAFTSPTNSDILKQELAKTGYFHELNSKCTMDFHQHATDRNMVASCMQLNGYWILHVYSYEQLAKFIEYKDCAEWLRQARLYPRLDPDTTFRAIMCALEEKYLK